MCVMSQTGIAWDQWKNVFVLNAKVKEINGKQPTDFTIFKSMVKTSLQLYMWFVWFPLDAASLSLLEYSFFLG